MRRVLVIGAGAAGLMAAVTASEAGCEVTVLEKNEKAGKKIYITGKGRCNFTNACAPEDFFPNVRRNSRFMYSSFYGMTNEDVISFFEQAGMKVKVERGNRAFPVSDHASDVTGSLLRVLNRQGVQIRYGTQVKRILIQTGERTKADTEDNPNQRIAGVKLKDGTRLSADAVIVCTGGLSYPSTGSTGDGYSFARAAGHKVTDCFPSLVPLRVREEELCRQMQGLSLKNVRLRMAQGKKILYDEQGEMLFTHFGVSGPLVLTASTYLPVLKELSTVHARRDCREKMSETDTLDEKGRTGGGTAVRKRAEEEGFKELQCSVNKGNRKDQETGQEAKDGSHNLTPHIVTLHIDLKPALSQEQLDARIQREITAAENKQVKNMAGRLYPATMVPVMLQLCGIDPELKCHSLTRQMREKLVETTKDVVLHVTGTGGFNEAIITRGGVDVKQIRPDNMESKLVEGLFFAGEVLDVDAVTGGFNLQIAWSTGAAAGRGAAQE